MKKTLLCLAVALLMLVCLCACGKHVHEYGEWQTEVEATCNTVAKEVRYCECGEAERRSVGDPLGHTFGDWSTVTVASCAVDGIDERFCVRCDYKEMRTVSSEKHSYGSWIVVVIPTCMEDGVVYRVCADCDNKDFAFIDAGGSHTEVIDEAVEATCSTTGLSQGKHCSSCGAVLVAQVEIAKTSHTYSSDSDNSCNSCGFIRDVACQHTSVTTLPAKAATCTEPGLTEGKVCNSCEYIIAEQTVIPYTGHTEVAIPAVAPTCTSTGKSEGAKCSVCGTVTVSQKTVEMSPHSYVSGKCSVCGDFEDKTPLEIDSISVDRTLVMTYNEVNFIVTSNKLPEQLTISAVIFLNGERVASIHGVGSLRYIPTVAGKYDAEISVTSDGINVYTSYIRDCFEVKDGWALSDFSADRNSITLGEKLTFSATIDGSTTDLSYEIGLYRNDELISTYEGVSEVEVYPGSEGTYHATIVVTDSYGERYTLKSQSVTATLNTANNPTYTVNQGTTLNLDELNDNWYYNAVVPSGKDIKLEWSKQSGDAYYELVIFAFDNDSDDYDVEINNYTSNNYTISSKNLIPGHKYQVYVDRIDSSDRIIGEFSVEFVVAGADSIFLEGELNLINPISKGVTPYSDLTLQWTKFNNASKYVISLDYSCGAAYHTIFKDVEVSGSQNYYSISKSELKQGCYYRFKIYVYDELENKTYITKYFDVEGDEELFRVSTPEITNSGFYPYRDEANKTYPSCEYLIVTWKDIPAAAYYSVTLDCKRSDYPDPVLVNADRIEGNSYAIPVKDLLGGCLYSIKVAAYCADGHDESTKAMYFRAPYTDGRELYPPEITSHDFSQDLNQPTTMVVQGFTFTWAPVSAAVTYSVFWYEYGYDDDVDYELKETTSTTVTIPRDSVYSSRNGTDFVLKIVAFDENDNGVTAYYYIRMVTSTIEAPIVTSPGLPTNDDGTLPSFDDDFTIRWSAVKDAVSYKVVIAEYDDEYYTILTYDNITDTFLEIPVWDELYEGCKYRIRVYAYDQYGNGLSSKYYFMVGEPDYMELSKDNLNFDYKASHQYTVLTTVGNWTAKSSASWITLDSYSGYDANRFKVSVTENTSDFARFGTVTFTNSAGGIVILTVSQDGNNASNSGRVQITSPEQGSTIENGSVTVKWTCQCEFAYFELALVDVTTGKTVYTKNNITSFYDQIPAGKVTSGHTYQIILYIYGYDMSKSTAASIAFKVEGGNSGYEPEQTPANFTVTFKDYDGTVLKVQTGIQYGKGATAPYVPDRAGYSFVGWSKSFSNVTSDLTVVAVYEAIATTECTHANKSFVRYDYEDFTYISTSTHSVKEIATYKCPDCSKVIETSRVKTESHVRDFEVNGGWACRCGHTQGISFTPYSANLQSEVNQATYYDSALTVYYGKVYTTDSITVMGESGDAYLIKYPLDAGGYKYAFISKQYIDSSKYVSNSKTQINVFNRSVSAVKNSGLVYVSLDELMSAFGSSAYYNTNEKYKASIVVTNSQNKEKYVLDIDLSSYATKNWANVYARPVNGGGNIVGFCIGAYVYCDEIYIEVSELMELLKYEADDNCYLPSSNTVNLRLYANSVNILNGGVWFDALYDDCLGSETAGFVTSLLYHVLTGNYGDYFSSSDYNKDDEMVESVKKMLYDRCYPVSAENLDIPSDYAAALTELSSLISDGTSAIGMTMESLSKLIAGAPGASRIYESLGICFSNFSENVASEADGLWKNVEFGSLVLEEVILVVSLQFKYEENIAILDLLIEEETNPRVVSIYEKVKSELDVYYANKALGLLNTLVTNPKIRDTFVANTVDELKDFAESGIQFTNPYLVAYKLTVFVADDILNGEALYDAQNGIYRMHNSLELYMPSLADAIDDYYNNPTKQNEQRLLAVASVAAHMRLLATDYCIEYLESKMFNNDTEAFEMEKESIEHYIKNLNSLYDALS